VSTNSKLSKPNQQTLRICGPARSAFEKKPSTYSHSKRKSASQGDYAKPFAGVKGTSSTYAKRGSTQSSYFTQRYDPAPQSSPKAHLSTDPTLSRLVLALDEMLPIQTLIENQLPFELAQQTRAVAVSQGDLMLVVATPAAATALTPRLPALKRRLNQSLAKEHGILEIRVQVRIETIANAIAAKQRAKPKGAAPPWQALADGLAEKSPLKETLERLARENSAQSRRASAQSRVASKDHLQNGAEQESAVQPPAKQAK
jgi:Dna[CI] antecedent, DciA